MKDLLKIQQKLIPQVIELMEKRYSILRQISLSEPVGRRTLSNILGISERVVRSETEFLKDQGLIDVAVSGMTITYEGIKLLDELKDVINDVMGLSTLQEKVKNKLGIKKVLLVSGSFDSNNSLIKDVARCAICIITDKRYTDVTVVPARGSMGTDVEIQSNNIVAITSKKLHSNYKLLNIPDELGEEAMKTLSQEPEIKNTLDYIQKTNVLVFAIGKASEMTKRRKLPEDKVDEIISKGAVGEAFGHYFNEKGEIVYKLNTAGIDLETFKNVEESIAIFAGKRKANALIALSNVNKNIVLVTDEESAKAILEQ